MRIIGDSIKDHLIPQVSSKKTPKQMYDRRNINRKMNPRAQLKDTKMSKEESIQDYFTRGFPVQRATKCYWRHP